MSKKNEDIKKITAKKSVDEPLADILDPDDEVEDLDDEDDAEEEEDTKEVDIADVEDAVTEDEEGAAIISSPSPKIDDEDEEEKSFVEEPSDDADDEDNRIERARSVEEMASDSNKIQVSKEERDRVIARLSWLKAEGRKDIAEKLKTARDFGDLSENAEYEAAKKEQAFIEGEISDLQQRLEIMEVVDYYGIKDDAVHVGNIVKIERQSDKKVSEYFIVGSSYESDMYCEPKKVSTDSPVGGGLISGKVGQEISVKLPHGITEAFRILNISH